MLSLKEYESLIPDVLRRSTSLSVIITDTAGKYTYTNEVFRQRYSSCGDDFMGKDVLVTIHPDDHHKCVEAVEKCFLQPANSVRVILRKPEIKGSYTVSDWEFSALTHPDGMVAGVLCIGQDLTETEANARRLVDFHQKLLAVLNEMPEGFVEMDGAYRITHVNRAAEVLLGCSSEQLMGSSLEVFMHPTYAGILKSETTNVSSGMAHRSMNVRSTDFKRWFRIDLHPSPEGVHAFISDITDVRTGEMHRQELLELTLGQNERLRSFAHIVSHNLRSHTNNIGALLKMLANDHPSINNSRGFDLLSQSADRLQETVANLSTVARMTSSSTADHQLVNLLEKVEHALSVVSADLKLVSAECSVDVSSEWSVEGVSSYVESVLLNLVTNAVKYRHPDRLLRLRVTGKESDRFYQLSITDNGRGIDLVRHGSKLFGMYRTFHDHPDAQGIGLFISKNQMEAMGGFINVESIHDEGSVFTVGFKKPTQ